MSHTLSMDMISKTTHITVVTTLKSNLRSPMSNPYLLNVHLKIKERISSSLIPPRKEFMKFWLGKLVPFLVKYMPSYILLFLQSSLVSLIIQYPDQAWATFTVAHIPMAPVFPVTAGQGQLLSQPLACNRMDEAAVLLSHDFRFRWTANKSEASLEYLPSPSLFFEIPY